MEREKELRYIKASSIIIDLLALGDDYIRRNHAMLQSSIDKDQQDIDTYQPSMEWTSPLFDIIPPEVLY